MIYNLEFGEDKVRIEADLELNTETYFLNDTPVEEYELSRHLTSTDGEDLCGIFNIETNETFYLDDYILEVSFECELWYDEDLKEDNLQELLNKRIEAVEDAMC